jgi:methyl-accepting chemotaxis protein
MSVTPSHPSAGERTPQVDAVLPVLPVLARQLRETQAQVETSVVNVCSNFNGMASRARSGVEQATKLLGGGESGDGGTLIGLIESSHGTLDTLMTRIVRGGELSMKAVYRMDDVEEGMKRISSILSAVSDVATRTRLLTVNAKIEAARVGEQGKGFAVVAGEISQLSAKSAEIVESITEILTKLSADVGATVSDLRELASADMGEVLLGKQRIEESMHALEARHTVLQDRLRAVAAEGEALADEIAGAVVGLQFQDRVNQRLGHVIEGIETVEKTLASRGAVRAGELVNELQQRYTMAEERGAATSAPRAPRAPLGGRQAAPDADVVLF